MDPSYGYQDSSLDFTDLSGFASSAQGHDGVSTWDYAADGLARRPSPIDLWAIQQTLAPGATYGFGLESSNSTWPDISLSEFLKSPSPVPQVRPSDTTVSQ